jgi:hypothetical protein
VSFQVLKPVAGTPVRKKKPMEVNFDDIDLDALIEGNDQDTGSTRSDQNNTSSQSVTPPKSPKTEDMK